MKKSRHVIFCVVTAALAASASPSSALSIPVTSIVTTGYGLKQPIASFQAYIFCIAGTAGAMMRAGYGREEALTIARWDCGSYFYGWDRKII